MKKISRLFRPLKKQNGFTIVEAMAGFLIFAILTLIIYSGFVTARLTTTKGKVLEDQKNQVINSLEGKNEPNVKTSSEHGSYIELRFGGETISLPGKYITVTDPTSPSFSLMTYQKLAGFDAYSVFEDMVSLHAYFYTLTAQERITVGLPFYVSNDLFRKYLLSHTYENAWPTLSADFIQEYGILMDGNPAMYVQSYINASSSTPTKADVFVYANYTANDNNGGNWKAFLIYDHEERCWYVSPKHPYSDKKYDGWSIAEKTWPQVKEHIHKKNADPKKDWVKIM